MDNDVKMLMNTMMVIMMAGIVSSLLLPTSDGNSNGGEPPASLVTTGYMRNRDNLTSGFYSGWVQFTELGGLVGLDFFKPQCEVGFAFVNNSDEEQTYSAEMWTVVDDVPGDSLPLPLLEPPTIAPAPTGLPYMAGEYLVDKFVPSGGKLLPGEIGFVYSPLITLSSPSLTTVHIALYVDGQVADIAYIGGYVS